MNQWAAINIPADPYFRVMTETATGRFGFDEANLTLDCLNLVKSHKAYIRWEALDRWGNAAQVAGRCEPR